MIIWQDVLEGISLVAAWNTPLLVVTGLLIGLIFGAIPGLTSSLGIAVLLPLTFLMEPITALIFLTSVYTGGMTGGGITAILLNTPGTPGAVATTFDGYPMTKKGLQSEALGLQIASSAIGGLVGYTFLLFLIHPMVAVALKFGPAEMIFLTLLLLVIIGTLGESHLSRTLIIGFFGLLLGTIGTNPATGLVHGTMGLDELVDGIPFVAVIIALFAVPEMLDLITREYITEVSIDRKFNIKRLLKGMRSAFRYKSTLIRSSIIGIAVGLLPGIGSTLGSLLSYAQAKRRGKPGQRFGEGEPEGVVAAETANNASEGGAMGILLALGIPGSSSTAMLLAAIMLHGLLPGPRLLRDQGPLVYGLITANILQMIVLVVLAVIVASYMGRIVFVPTRILAPVMLVIMTLGAYSVRFLMFDVYTLFFFGILGWFIRTYNFPLTAFMVGLILGRRLEDEVYRYLSLFGTDLSVFVERPIAAILAAVILFTLGINVYKTWLSRRL